MGAGYFLGCWPGAPVASAAASWLALPLAHGVYSMCSMSLAQSFRAVVRCGKLHRGSPVILGAVLRQAKRKGVVTRAESIILPERFPPAVRTDSPSS
jgi:hypothetical protein